MKTQHEVLMEDPEFRKLLSIEALVAGASEMVAKLMVEQNVSKADLARKLNKSRSWVTQLLSGEANMTIRTLAEVIFTLNAEVKLHAHAPASNVMKGSSSAWQPLTYKMSLESIASADLFRLKSSPSVEPDSSSFVLGEEGEYAA